jgi:hypothetical protein
MPLKDIIPDSQEDFAHKPLDLMQVLFCNDRLEWV